MNHPPTIVGIGELVWDLLPSGRQLGGAPANFAYCTRLLGNNGVVVSRVGEDVLGQEARERLHEAVISDQFVQGDTQHATGTVSVDVDPAGQPKFEIAAAAAWDFLEWNADMEKLAQSCDAVCFGTLAQRSAQSRRTILSFINATRSECLRVFDVNLRQSFYSAEIVRESLRGADVVKLNEHELPVVADLLGITASDFCRAVVEKFELKMICVTRGEKGSVLFGRDGIHEHPGVHVEVNDTVGAGDAFTAGLVHEYMRGGSLSRMNETANRMGAWVSSCAGAMPKALPGLDEILAYQSNR